MSNRSFIDRAAEERRQGLIVGRVVLGQVILGQVLGARLVGGFELIEHGVDRFIGIGSLALPLHRVEIVHIGLIGLFIVAEQAHRTSNRERHFYLTRFLPQISLRNLRKLDRYANRYPLRSKTLRYSTTFGTRKKWFSVA